jgi:hypothetical protein
VAAAVAATVLALATAAHVPAVVLLLGPGTATGGLLVLSAAAALRQICRRDAGATASSTSTIRSVPDTTEPYDRSPSP